jgi:exodeoxyribonuclease V alpha subunit
VHRGAYSRAAAELTAWAQAWRPLLPAMPTDPQQIAEIAGRSDYPLQPGAAFTAAGRTQAEAAHPEHARLVHAAAAATAAAERAGAALTDARHEDADRATRFGRLADTPDPAARLTDAGRELAATRQQLADIRMSVATLQAEPASRTQPADQSASEPAGRRAPGHLDRHQPRPEPKKSPAPERHLSHPRPEDLRDLGYLQHGPRPGRGISR